MIVDRMNDQELWGEILKDYESIANFYESISHNLAYKKRLLWGRPKNGEFVIRIKDWKSPRHNFYTFIIRTSGWNEFKKGEFSACTLTFFKRNNAQNAIRILFRNGGDLNIEIFTSHFIDRYNQRFLKKPYLSHKEVILQYVDRNIHAVIKNLDSSKHKNSVMTATTDGYTFGKYVNNEVLVNKTFVSREMLFGEQFDEADALDEAVQDSKKGILSNISDFVDELESNNQKGIDLPTMGDLLQGFDMIEKKNEIMASLEEKGKEYDLELLNLQNQFFLWAAKFDWTKGQIRDEEGNHIDHPIMKEIATALGTGFKVGNV